MASTINASTSSGLVNTADTSGVLQLQTANTTAVTIDASQNVGIGTASPSVKLDIVGELKASNGTYGTYLTYSAGNQTGIVGTYGNHGLEFRTNNTERMRVLSTGNILSLSGGSTTATGTGITFPATQSASSDANTLDDYEEGTFTPTIIGSSTSGSATYSTQLGVYRKIGSLVYVSITLDYTSGTGSGGLLIQGLPFTTANIGQGALYTIRADAITLNANSYPMAVSSPNNTIVNIQQSVTGTPTIATVSYDGAGFMQVSGCYVAA